MDKKCLVLIGLLVSGLCVGGESEPFSDLDISASCYYLGVDMSPNWDKVSARFDTWKRLRELRNEDPGSDEIKTLEDQLACQDKELRDLADQKRNQQSD